MVAWLCRLRGSILYGEENILRRHGHDKMKQPIDVNSPGESLGLKGQQPGGDRLMLWSSLTDIFP